MIEHKSLNLLSAIHLLQRKKELHMHISYLDRPAINHDVAAQIAIAYITVGMGHQYSNDFIEKLYEKSTYYVLAKVEGKVVGLIRVLSDEFLTSWIAEVLVLPEYQNKGIGSEMLRMVKEKYKNTAIYTHSSPGASTDFFGKNGIQKRELLLSCAIAPQS